MTKVLKFSVLALCCSLVAGQTVLASQMDDFEHAAKAKVAIALKTNEEMKAQFAQLINAAKNDWEDLECSPEENRNMSALLVGRSKGWDYVSSDDTYAKTDSLTYLVGVTIGCAFKKSTHQNTNLLVEVEVLHNSSESVSTGEKTKSVTTVDIKQSKILSTSEVLEKLRPK